MATIQIIDKETLSNKKYSLEYIKFAKPNLQGVIHDKENEVYFRPDAVSVLLVDEKRKKFILTRQFRLPTFLNGNDTGYMLETVAGLIDGDETPEQTVIREVEEEAGYHITEIDKVAGAYSSGGGITEFVHFFIAHYTPADKKGNGGGVETEGEDIEVIEMNISEARSKLKNAEFKDAKTIILLQHYFLNS